MPRSIKSSTIKKNSPFKIDPFLSHVQSVSMESWDMGRNISADEQTIGFKGQHQDKQRISYKREGDGFLAQHSSDVEFCVESDSAVRICI
jgi:hypothetical protein